MHNHGNYFRLAFKLIKACTCVVSFAPKLNFERVVLLTPLYRKGNQGSERLSNLPKLEVLTSNKDIIQNSFSWLQIRIFFFTLGELSNPLAGHGTLWECKGTFPGQKQLTNSFLRLPNIVWEWGVPGINSITCQPPWDGTCFRPLHHVCRIIFPSVM